MILDFLVMEYYILLFVRYLKDSIDLLKIWEIVDGLR